MKRITLKCDVRDEDAESIAESARCSYPTWEVSVEGIEGPTYTYRDNPYPESTREYDIWFTAFVHGLNSQARQELVLLGMLENYSKKWGTQREVDATDKKT